MHENAADINLNFRRRSALLHLRDRSYQWERGINANKTFPVIQ